MLIDVFGLLLAGSSSKIEAVSNGNKWPNKACGANLDEHLEKLTIN